MILRPKPSTPSLATLRGAAPGATVPAWLRRAVPGPQSPAGKEVEDVALTAGAVLGAASAVRLFAHGEFTSFGESVWWAAQTVTTVGYGDVIPNTAFSKVVAVIVMIFGISTVSLSTAVITSVVISSMQRRDPTVDPYGDALEDIAKRLEVLERIEHRLLTDERPAAPG